MNMPVQTNREKIQALQSVLLTQEQPEFELSHFFAHGTYTRQLFIPAGVVLTGRIHRFSCINIISQGKALAVSDEGEYEITAPYTFVSGPGVKKAIYALEDTVWTTVHAWTGEQDPDFIVHALTIPEELI